MKFISWNCRGLARPQAKRALRALIRKHNPICVFLMETKVNSVFMEACWRRLGFTEGVDYDPMGLAGGVCMFWRSSMRIQVNKVSVS